MHNINTPINLSHGHPRVAAGVQEGGEWVELGLAFRCRFLSAVRTMTTTVSANSNRARQEAHVVRRPVRSNPTKKETEHAGRVTAWGWK